MANWIFCEYHGASVNPALPNNGLPINDQPVNLDLCETIKTVDVQRMGVHQLIFQLQKNDPIIWEFINSALLALEYNRAIELMRME